MRSKLPSLAIALLLAGCSTEEERFAWNVQHAVVCPSARTLTERDVQAIARLVAHATRQNIMAITTFAPDYSLRKVRVTTAFHNALEGESPDRSQFGYCDVAKDGETWKIVEIASDLDPILARMAACIDPPKT